MSRNHNLINLLKGERMPVFDYRCECGHEQEKFVQSAEQLVECPKCGAVMKKQLAAPGDFKCKGDGFYKPGANFKK
jgi:putative FmdB family regulatory protein